ncbi:MAG: TonB-dependent receptor [Cyclobacteriaceae bacterium]
MKHILIGVLIVINGLAYSQNTLTLKVIDKESNEPLIGATVQLSETLGGVTDINGEIVFDNIPNDQFTLSVSFVGYEKHIETLSFPEDSSSMTISLVDGHELEEIIISTTRSGRTIDAIPTRVEVIGNEEMQEKAIMRSANIAMVLRESTGIQMQQTSASSGNQSIRIQGLDGRYTQILKDGFPLFGGFGGGLSIMQIPPLDLKQVEIVKGSNSTLYGGGAIAGLVNLVTYTPADGDKLKLMLDQTTAGGTTFNTFYGKKFNKFGVTLFGSINRQEAYDPNEDDFSDIPKIRSFTFNPSLFYYFSDQSKLRLTMNATLENRLGGDIQVIENEPGGIHQFTEENESDRLSYQLSYGNQIDDNRSISIKNSLTYFEREIESTNFQFSGKQWSSFTEASYNFGESGQWITGLNLYTDKFEENPLSGLSRDYEYMTVGGFTQNTWSISENFSAETGLRLDLDKDYGFFALPRVSFLTNLSKSMNVRLGGGLGYKLPTIFTEDAENITFENVLPIDIEVMKAERSIGGNFDINFKKAIGNDWTLSLNQLFFITHLNDALVFRENEDGQYFYENANGPVQSSGLETNLKLTYKDFKLFANYAFINTLLKYDNLNQQKPLTPKHSIGAVLVYEVHDKWRIGYESYFTGEQFLADRTKTDDFWTMGLMAMRKIGKVSLYINFENFTDTRQHKLENFDVQDHFKPEFPQIWAPTDGRIINGGLILEL